MPATGTEGPLVVTGRITVGCLVITPWRGVDETRGDRQILSIRPIAALADDYGFEGFAVDG